jgi:hypothetical protein
MVMKKGEIPFIFAPNERRYISLLPPQTPNWVAPKTGQINGSLESCSRVPSALFRIVLFKGIHTQ